MGRQFKPGQLQTGSLYNISSSFALTASFALNGGGSFPFSGSAVITGSLYVSGSGITGSLLGTASYATNALSASYIQIAQTASYIVTAQTASYILQAVSSSYATTALSASYAPFVATNTGSLLVTASISNANITFTKGNSTTFGITVNNVASASYATTASYLTGYISPFPYTGSALITGSLGITGSLNVSSGITASLFGTASWALNSATASYIETAQTASYILNAISSSYATTASNALTSSYAPLYIPISATSSMLQPYVLTSSTASMSVLSSSYAQTASYAPAYLPLTGGTINGNVTINGTASIAFLNVTYESASVIYSSGSNQFGDASNDVQTLWGTVDIKSGPVLVTGSLRVTSGITGSLFGTASYATNALSASYAPGGASSPPFPYTGSAKITGSLGITGSLSNGDGNIASGIFSHAEGLGTNSTGQYSHTEGYYTISTGIYSHAEGRSTTSAGNYSHAEGNSSQANGQYSHAEGYSTTSTGVYSHAEGASTTATGDYSHAEGASTTATGDYSHAEGSSTTASGAYSHAEGLGTNSSGSYQHVQGQYNILSSAQSAFILGNGTNAGSRSNLIFASGSQVQITGSVVATSGFTGSLQGTASYATNALSASYAQTASYATYAANGGVTKILAGANVNLSPVSGLGDVTVTSFGTNLYNTATGSYGSFYDTGSVLAASATAVYSMSLSTTDISNGVFVSASNGDVTRVKFTNAGTYNLQFSSQFSNTDNSNQDVVIWVKKNGVDVVDSSGVAGVPAFKAGSNGQVIAAWNYYLSLSAGDFIQMCWHVEQANVITLETIAAGTSPTHPRTPSTILTATRVDTFLSNTGSFSGSFTGTLTGTASYATNALSASWAPSTPAFPFTGSALITGSLGLTGSLSNGDGNIASGIFSHAEGRLTTSTGQYSHAEGYFSTSIGANSHVEGVNTTSTGPYSHAEGSNTNSTGPYSHAEGLSTTSTGDASHAEGLGTTSTGYASHTEGYYTISTGIYSHAEGDTTTATGQASHAEGAGTTAAGVSSHAEGQSTISSGSYSHAEGGSTISSGDYSHAEGEGTTSTGYASHAEGESTQASGDYSHAEGSGTTSIGYASHAEGASTTTGQLGYGPGTIITSGVFELDPQYGDLTSLFTPGVFVLIDDPQGQINGTPNIFKLEVASSTYTGTPATEITLVDTSINTSDLKYTVGIDGNFTPIYASIPIGDFSHTSGESTHTVGRGSSTEGYFNEALGYYQSVVGIFNEPINDYGAFIVGGGYDNTPRNLLVASPLNQIVTITGSATTYKPLTTQENISAAFTVSGEIVESANFDGAVILYDLISLVDGTWYQTDQAASNSERLLGIYIGGNKVLLSGYLTVNEGVGDGPLVSGTVKHGLVVYIQEAAVGLMDTTVPTANYVRTLGHILYANVSISGNWTMKFNPSNDWVKI